MKQIRFLGYIIAVLCDNSVLAFEVVGVKYYFNKELNSSIDC